MIARHYGADYSPETLRRHCGVSRRGVSMLGISEGARSIGFDTAGVRMTFQELAEEAPLPCILHWNHSHFVVCYGIDRDRAGRYRIRISDPASQRLTYTPTSFLTRRPTRWTPPTLDASNEAGIMHNLRTFYRDRTVVVCAHRLSTVCETRGRLQAGHAELPFPDGAVQQAGRGDQPHVPEMEL